jgi:5-formyltetrahydrofolate cyclo-ligase
VLPRQPGPAPALGARTEAYLYHKTMRPGAETGQPNIPLAGEEKGRLRDQLRGARSQHHETPAAPTARTVRALAACAGATTVAAYVSRLDEPDTSELITALWQAEVKVLLPVLSSQPDWAWYAGPGTLAPGPLGIYQPAGPRQGGTALAQADWIWLPGLAGTPDGRRLGTGGGWYDRALLLSRADAKRGLLLFDNEVLADLPTQDWDQPIDLLVTEERRIDCGNGIPSPVSEL